MISQPPAAPASGGNVWASRGYETSPIIAWWDLSWALLRVGLATVTSFSLVISWRGKPSVETGHAARKNEVCSDSCAFWERHPCEITSAAMFSVKFDEGEKHVH